MLKTVGLWLFDAAAGIAIVLGFLPALLIWSVLQMTGYKARGNEYAAFIRCCMFCGCVIAAAACLLGIVLLT
jgi:hypothetical protein